MDSDTGIPYEQLLESLTNSVTNISRGTPDSTFQVYISWNGNRNPPDWLTTPAQLEHLEFRKNIKSQIATIISTPGWKQSDLDHLRKKGEEFRLNIRANLDKYPTKYGSPL